MIRPALDLFRLDALPSSVIGLVPGDPLLSLWVRRHVLALSGIDPNEGSAVIDTRSGDEMPHSRILTRLRERPLFGGRRILWISRSDQCPDIDPKDLLERNQKSVTTLILEAPEKVLASWSKILPAFSLAAPTKPSDREAWAQFLAGKSGISLEKSALQPLLTTFEGSLGPMERLFQDLAREGVRKVTADALFRHGVTDHYKTVFDLIRGFENSDTKFFREWERFLEGGQSPFGLISLLHRQWRLYRIAANALGKNTGRSEAERMVITLGGVPAFVAPGVVRVAGRLSLEGIRKGTEALWQADLLLKSGVSSTLVMDQLAATLFSLSRSGKEEKGWTKNSWSRQTPQHS